METATKFTAEQIRASQEAFEKTRAAVNLAKNGLRRSTELELRKAY